ncbi:MAG: hypothetical protein JHC84_03560 [Solirubrobacteraceae bacterium]|nr:hypothetical protein [Solirubrobacteraceae bacterium]
MSGRQLVVLTGFVAVIAALLLAVARMETGAALLLVAAFGAYSAIVLCGAHRARGRVIRRAPAAVRRRTPPAAGPR